MPAGTTLGLKAKLGIETDDKEVRKETNSLKDKIKESATANITPDSDSLKSKITESIESASEDAKWMPDSGVGIGEMYSDQEMSDLQERMSALGKDTAALERANLGGSSSTAASAGTGGGGLGGKLAGMAGAGGKFLKVGLASVVGFGILKGVQQLSKAAPRLGKVVSMFRKAMSLFFRPFGDALGRVLEPFAEAALDMAANFNEAYSKDGLLVAIGSLAKDVATTLGGGTANAAKKFAMGNANASDILGLSVVTITAAKLLGMATWPVIGKVFLAGFIFGGLQMTASKILEEVFDVDPSTADILGAIFAGITMTAGAILFTIFSGISMTAGAILGAIFGAFTIGALAVINKILGNDFPLKSDSIIEALFKGTTIVGLTIVKTLFKGVKITADMITDAILPGSDNNPVGSSSGNSSHGPLPDFFGGGPIIPVNPRTPFASGGIVTDKTNAVIGEGQEDEAVLPLSKLSQLLDRERRRGQQETQTTEGSSEAAERLLEAVEELNRTLRNLDPKTEVKIGRKELGEEQDKSNERYRNSRIIK